MRWEPGPVFLFESLVSSRRWVVYAGRSVFVLSLLIGLSLVWASTDLPKRANSRPVSLKELAEIGEGFYLTLAAMMLVLVLLAAPAATAGSICLDRVRGTLEHMLVTELSAREIVLGKLAARLLPVFGLIACGFPVLAMTTLMGGVDPAYLFATLLVSLALATFGCALALMVSVWASKPQETLLVVFGIWAVWLLAFPVRAIAAGGPVGLPHWLRASNPFWLVLAPYADPGEVGPGDYVAFLVAVLAAAALAATIATLRIRSALAGRGDAPRRRPRINLDPWRLVARLPWGGPSLDDNPVLWREWHRNRPTRLTRIVWMVYVVFSSIALAWGLYEELHASRMNRFLPFALALQVFFGLLMASIGSSSALLEERARGSLDLLMATPLETRTIVQAKFWGAYRLVALLAILPTAGALMISLLTPSGRRPWPVGARPIPDPVTWEARLLLPLLILGVILSYGAAITSVGLLLATWIRRIGRAISVSVVLYLLLAIVWPILSDVLFWLLRSRHVPANFAESYRLNHYSSAVASASPFAAPLILYQDLVMSFYDGRGIVYPAVSSWILVAWGVTVASLEATVRSFDRCMGRADRSRPKPVLLARPGVTASGPRMYSRV